LQVRVFGWEIERGHVKLGEKEKIEVTNRERKEI